MGHIGIRDLEVYAYHGVYPEEQTNGQKFYVSADLYVDTWEAEHTDDLEASVNYGTVCERITAYMTNEKHMLIERAAGKICENLLRDFPKIEKIRLKLYKPEAPIPLPFGTVFVEVERSWEDVYIAVGCNMGDRRALIERAIEMLSETEGIEVKKVAALIETEPYGYTDQDIFLNGCLHMKTWLPPEVLLKRMQEIELLLHRERKIHRGPRTIDLDMILYGDQVIHTKDLTVPHPDMVNRQFVLEPLDEIGGRVWHPVENKTVHQLWETLKKKEAQEND